MHIDEINENALKQGTVSTMQILLADGNANTVAERALAFVAIPWVGTQTHLYMLTDFHQHDLPQIRNEVVDALARRGYKGMQFVAVIARGGHKYAKQLLDTEIAEYEPIEHLHLAAASHNDALTASAWLEAFAAYPDGFEVNLYGAQGTRDYSDALDPLKAALGISDQVLRSTLFMPPIEQPAPKRAEGDVRVWVFVGYYTISKEMVARALVKV